MQSVPGASEATAHRVVPLPLPPTPDIALPESTGYRLKNKLLGAPLHTEELENERLGIPTALAVFSSDCISSSAYATEEILRHLLPYIGLAAFLLVTPITVALLVVLGLLILSYRETIKAYPTAGGAYMVTRDNFGILPAQFAGVALLTDYILTVAVSVAAGTAALTSAAAFLSPYRVPISLSFIAIIALTNLKGVRESGKLFAVPTYFFITVMGLLLAVGFYKMSRGQLHPQLIPKKGMIEIGRGSDGALHGLGLFALMTAFASGGAAVTGVEAISNGVTAFKKPEWLNARKTLVIMGGILAVLFLGLSILSTRTHAVPYESGSPTVISQIGKTVFGGGVLGNVLFYSLQGGTMLILVLAANTSFADFPRLASFAAGDNFLPRQLMKRGHRLVFSNGVISLALSAAVIVTVTGAKVDRLIPLYAIGVFTSFTLSQAGMAKHHLRLREPHWKRGLVINGVGGVISFLVAIIVGVTKFKHGAWFIILLIPILVAVLVRLNRQYVLEEEQLEEDAEESISAPILRRHVVLVMVNKLDTSTARAIQYARTLMPDELRAVHIAVDRTAAQHLADRWRRLGLSRVSLELVDCPDRRVDRAAVEVVAAELDGSTEVTVLLPHRVYSRFWHRLLHDNTANEIAGVVGKLPHANVTTVPFHFEPRPKKHPRAVKAAAPHEPAQSEPE